MTTVLTAAYQHIEEIKAFYQAKREDICRRMEEFEAIWDRGSKEEIFTELVYCIITPMARGKMCFAAVDSLVNTGLLFAGTQEQIKTNLIGARFIQKKSSYIVEARKKFMHDGSKPLQIILDGMKDDSGARTWLVENIKGIGYKEASHFLRNIGFSSNLAILDRHIIRNLCFLEVIESVPETLSRRQYLDIENRMRRFSNLVHIPMGHLDLLLWCKETGEILK